MGLLTTLIVDHGNVDRSYIFFSSLVSNMDVNQSYWGWFAAAKWFEHIFVANRKKDLSHVYSKDMTDTGSLLMTEVELVWACLVQGTVMTMALPRVVFLFVFCLLFYCCFLIKSLMTFLFKEEMSREEKSCLINHLECALERLRWPTSVCDRIDRMQHVKLSSNLAG